VSLGSDDQLAIWLNGQEVLRENEVRALTPGQSHAELKLKAGKNQLLVKVGNIAGDWAFYVLPEFPASWPASVRSPTRKATSRRPWNGPAS